MPKVKWNLPAVPLENWGKALSPLQKFQRIGEVLAKYSDFDPNVGLEGARTSPPGTLWSTPLDPWLTPCTWNSKMGFFGHFLKSNYLIPPAGKAKLVIILILLPRKPSFRERTWRESWKGGQGLEANSVLPTTWMFLQAQTRHVLDQGLWESTSLLNPLWGGFNLCALSQINWDFYTLQLGSLVQLIAISQWNFCHFLI